MTIVAAVRFDDKIMIGCDSLVTSGDLRDKPANFCKLFEFGPNIIIGFAGINCMYHILKKKQKSKTKLKVPKTADDAYNLCKPLFKEYKKTIDEALADDKDVAELLIITNKSIFSCTEHSAEEHFKFKTIGSGSDYALGALHVSYPSPKCLLDSLKATCYYSASCGGDLVIKEIKRVG